MTSLSAVKLHENPSGSFRSHDKILESKIEFYRRYYENMIYDKIKILTVRTCTIRNTYLTHIGNTYLWTILVLFPFSVIKPEVGIFLSNFTSSYKYTRQDASNEVSFVKFGSPESNELK